VFFLTIRYDDVKPWGRSYDEYVRMFSLTPADLQQRILGCGDGPASFNAEMHAAGHAVISIDPIYQFSAAELRQRISETYEDVIGQARHNASLFRWDEIGSVDDLGRRRMSAMERFLEDYETGREQQRYVYGELPSLPFRDRQFDLALCSHLLFLYTDNLSLDFHLASIRELCRVAEEVRVFPLIDANGNRSAYFGPVIDFVREQGMDAAEVNVDYEFQKDGNTMLVIKEK
jgi:hypothetical protein